METLQQALQGFLTEAFMEEVSFQVSLRGASYEKGWRKCITVQCTVFLRP